ncbi:MAG: DUF3857 domain-containing protein [Bacteroidia bacterium]|nr:DUF3857 domain-containing protein [Bacteroidia bacterium]
MRHLLHTGLVVALMACIQPLHAQPKSRALGKVEEDYVSMTTFQPDSGAAAVYLLDECRITFDVIGDKFKAIYDFHYRIKILSAGVIDDLASREIEYFISSEGVSGIKGVTLNYENGAVVESKLEKEGIFDEEIGPGLHARKFTMPNVREGSVIDIMYQYYDEDPVFLKTWYFQNLHPTVYSELTINVPTGFRYNPLFRGNLMPINQKENAYTAGSLPGNQWIYSVNDIPAFVREPYMGNFLNYAFHVDFQLTNITLPGYYQDFSNSWGKIRSELIESDYFGGYLKESNDTREMLATLLAKTGDKDTLAAIARYLREEVDWSGRYGIVGNNIKKEILKNKTGNGAALNLLLVSLARAAGMEANPVLISRRTQEMVQTLYPRLGQFNHTIARVIHGKDTLMLDLAASQHPWNLLPYNDLNGPGFMVSGSGYDFVAVSSRFQYDHQVQVIASLTTDGTLDGNMTLKYAGYFAPEARRELDSYEKDLDKYLKENILSDATATELQEPVCKNQENPDLPVEISSHFTSTDYVTTAGEFIYVQPVLFEQLKKNPFSEPERRYPIDFGCNRQERFVMSFTIPEGYAIESIPKPTRASVPDKSATFQYNASVMGNMVQVMSTYQIRRPFYMPDEYEAIRALFDMIAQKEAEQIVIRKLP